MSSRCACRGFDVEVEVSGLRRLDAEGSAAGGNPDLAWRVSLKLLPYERREGQVVATKGRTVHVDDGEYQHSLEHKHSLHDTETHLRQTKRISRNAQ